MPTTHRRRRPHARCRIARKDARRHHPTNAPWREIRTVSSVRLLGMPRTSCDDLGCSRGTFRLRYPMLSGGNTYEERHCRRGNCVSSACATCELPLMVPRDNAPRHLGSSAPSMAVSSPGFGPYTCPTGGDVQSAPFTSH